MTDRVTFSSDGLYRLRTAGSDSAVFWCIASDVEDGHGPWIMVFESEATHHAGSKPLIHMSQCWFRDIVLERVP